MSNFLYGAILGDLSGQPYEFKYKGDYSEFKLHDEKSKITDDTYMTLAVASKLLGMFPTYEEAFRDMGKRYPGDNYGKGFSVWLKSDNGFVGNSWGNGCLMRVSPIIYYYLYLDKESNGKSIISELYDSCEPSHDNIDSYNSLNRLLKLYLNENTLLEKIIFKYSKYEPFKKFIVHSIGTISFIEKASVRFKSTKHAIEDVVKKGGDTDTNASIIGELMNFRYDDLNSDDILYVESKLDDYLLDILYKFNLLFE